MKKLLFITLISLIPLANADKYFDRTTWYCAPEKSAGLRYNRLTKEYEMAKFKQEKIMLVEEKSKFDKDNWHFLKIKKKKSNFRNRRQRKVTSKPIVPNSCSTTSNGAYSDIKDAKGVLSQI